MPRHWKALIILATLIAATLSFGSFASAHADNVTVIHLTTVDVESTLSMWPPPAGRPRSVTPWCSAKTCSATATGWPRCRIRLATQELVPGDTQGVGRRVRYVIKGRLPLRLAFDATTTRSAPPRDQELQAEGELAGTGRWSLTQQGEVTTVRYTWDVRTTRLWMNLLAPIARPIFTWNSKGVMLQAGEGLARLLGARLVSAEFTAPPGSGMRRLGGAALAMFVVWLLGGRVRSVRHG
jgi:hypothetical protein